MDSGLQQAEPAPKPAIDHPRQPAPDTGEAPQTPTHDSRNIAAAQQKAKAVFSAKRPPRSRTMLFAGTAAAIVVGGIAIFGAYYWQIISGTTAPLPPNMTPQAAMTAPPAAAPAPVDASPGPQPTDAAYDSARSSDRSGSESRAGGATASPNAGEIATQKAPVAVTQKDTSAAQPSPPTPPADSSASSGQAIRIRQTAATSQLNPALGKAYKSFLSGDIDVARQQYQKVLQQEPSNRDALLGLAAVAQNRKQPGQAAAYYGKLLELDPADPEALAGLVGLQGQTDPVQSESNLKKVLAQNPQAGAVHFALGNLYTQQSRWAEAQQSYFRAYSSAPNNADYAFNLAVSLDHLNQGKLALEYYQRAIALAQSGPANFDTASAQNRIKELQPATGR